MKLGPAAAAQDRLPSDKVTSVYNLFNCDK